jgi:pimeloyl-ACP methyl ester carboxylesterase
VLPVYKPTPTYSSAFSNLTSPHITMSSSTPTLVNIGTHSLALYTHGPDPSTPSDPVLVFIPGIASSRLVWSAVLRQLPASLRSYTYDRSGFGNSEPSRLAPTAETIAQELWRLLTQAAISNPLVLVGHSWAGVLIAEFLALQGAAARVAGVVLVDANHESALQVLDPNDADLRAVAAGVDAYAGMGVEAEHKLTRGEWDAFVADQAGEAYSVVAEREEAEYVASFVTLRAKGQPGLQPLLGSKPVFVIGGMRSRDWSGLYRAGVERGNGTEEQRARVRDLIASADEKSEGLMREFCKLSTKSKLVFARESGHFVQLTQPEVVVEGIEWVLRELRTGE